MTSILLFFFFFYCYGDLRDLHSFPTRRSSDLSLDAEQKMVIRLPRSAVLEQNDKRFVWLIDTASKTVKRQEVTIATNEDGRDRKSTRSELQSHSDLVCRLLLEKKKKK